VAQAFEQSDEAITGINVTPLVDICLVLLIIFMVTASYIVRDTIEVELPRAAHGGETVQQETFAVVITRAGERFLNGAPVDDAGLTAAVASARSRGAEVQALVGADRLASHGDVTHVLDVLKGAGVLKFAVEIERQ
jgi:biopolymer transport protein ExbD